MTFVQARDAIISGLETHMGCAVVLSDQIVDVPEYRIVTTAYWLREYPAIPSG